MDAQPKAGSDFLPTVSLPEHQPKRPGSSKFGFLLRFLLLTGIGIVCWTTKVHRKWDDNRGAQWPGAVESDAKRTSICAQANPLVPKRNGELWANLSAILSSDNFQSKAIHWLSDAVQVPTESFDNMDPVGEDPRWKVFEPFHEYLLKAFPLVHTTLELTKVNTYGLVFEWKGYSPSLKPVLFAAHQDVVPVETRTVDQWTHPPFSGHFDGEKIWGRGSSDDKSGLIGVLAAVETLISKGFWPTRTLVLAFGFDEEVSGPQGAGHIAPFLLDLYGKDGFAFVIDEGAGFAKQYGATFATPGIAEKGYIDVLVEVATAGGHSSIPPEHTTIGILSALLVHFEQHPFKAHLNREDPLYESFQCFAEHGTGMPKNLRNLIKRSATCDKALHKLEKVISDDRILKSLVGTTQAIDIIHGGVKANALPEQAYALVNHRIAVSSSVEKTKHRDTELLKPLAHKFNLAYSAFGESITPMNDPSLGTLSLKDAFHDGLEPAPVTPSGRDAAPYQLLSGTIKATYNSHRGLQGTNSIIIAPGMMTGNTDTRYYWDLSPHIFRYNHHNAGDTLNGLKGIHTVNEYIEIDALLEMIRFFVTLILNSDESQTL